MSKVLAEKIIEYGAHRRARKTVAGEWLEILRLAHAVKEKGIMSKILTPKQVDKIVREGEGIPRTLSYDTAQDLIATIRAAWAEIAEYTKLAESVNALHPKIDNLENYIRELQRRARALLSQLNESCGILRDQSIADALAEILPPKDTTVQPRS